jgi:dTDP-4-dehydrorhamnose reductase
MTTDKPRMLIIGARGFRGAHLTCAAAGRFEVVRGDRVSQARPESIQIDVTDEASVNAAFESTRPDVVLLLATLSDIDRCQTERDLAYAVNVHGAEHVANATARCHARLLFTSSAAIFDGGKHGYSEDDPANPVSIYGETKARTEAAVLGIVLSAVIVRIALAIGFAATKGTNSLLDSLAELWAADRAVEMPTFEYRNPIDAVTLCSFILQLLNQGAHGVFHVAQESLSPATSWV